MLSLEITQIGIGMSSRMLYISVELWNSLGFFSLSRYNINVHIYMCRVLGSHRAPWHSF